MFDKAILSELGIKETNFGAGAGPWRGQTRDQGELKVYSPADQGLVGSVFKASPEDYEHAVAAAAAAFEEWRRVPAPQRGELVRQVGLKLREYKDQLGRLVSYEMGKSLREGWGEVQEMIDIADFAVGQSRQLYGSTMVSERASHRMYDQYHPLGAIGVITAFNFPAAVWAWNALLAAVCGDSVLWKPSSKTPLTALAIQHLVHQVPAVREAPAGLFSLIIGDGRTVGERMLKDARLPLISLTGSTRVGRRAAVVVAERLGRCILELGGNNAIILTPHADLNLAAPSIVFGAVGTAGQRCTTTRRLIIHESIYDRVTETLVRAYGRLKIGHPLDPENHVGPLIDREAVQDFSRTLARVQGEGGRILCGGKVLEGPGFESGCYVEPALVEAENHYAMVQEETFAPILYLIKYSGGIEEAVAIQNGVRQGLSSAVFTSNLHEAETFLSAWGSDCGLANVNIGTSGAEIGGAFGGEKETGGGRESGSDAWKAYMRRQTNTINYGRDLPLAQGIKFEI
ncbi:MAG: aldehyde dehydrogenase family protein [Pseudomonadota bacterium]